MAQENDIHPAENLLFEKSKGMLPCPIEKINKIGEQSSANRGSTFFTDSAYMVKAIYDGVVVTLAQIDSAYFTITRYGDYFIGYYGTEKPSFKKNDRIKSGQEIGKLVKDNNEYSLYILIATTITTLDTEAWFRKDVIPSSSFQ